MTYNVKEIFYTIQGEGINAGRPAVFCRFVGCNLWSGKDNDKATADCSFCDTDFIGGFKVKTSLDLVEMISKVLFDGTNGQQHMGLVVITGGEPALQINQELIDLLHVKGFEVALETNGTINIPDGIDWVCVSPKGLTQIVVTHGNELKYVYPQERAPESYEVYKFDHFLLQPKAVNYVNDYEERAIKYCKTNPKWRFSAQLHKVWGIA